jgi:hypothetical protein
VGSSDIMDKVKGKRRSRTISHSLSRFSPLVSVREPTANPLSLLLQTMRNKSPGSVTSDYRVSRLCMTSALAIALWGS